MTNIVCDSSVLMGKKEGASLGLSVTPLSVTIDGKTYREYEEISSSDFLNLVRQGHVPTSSQPALGETLEVYNALDGEILNLSMADGLSGTYQSACSAKETAKNKDAITVINTGTLCGPHRYLVRKALSLAKEGRTTKEILDALQPSLSNHKSFLIPQDFSFLKRGGRLTPLAANVGALLHLTPVMTQTKDGKRLEKYTICRNMTGAVRSVIRCFEKMMVDEHYSIFVSHCDAQEDAALAAKLLHEAFPHTEIEILELSPVFITQGGPLCVAIQIIHQ